MALHKKIEYDPRLKRATGYVDLGFEDNETGETVAKEALVFMLVGLKKKWKAPIAYYFTNSLTAETQGQLLCTAIAACHDCGLKIVSLTLDGTSVNFSMCESLGANLEPGPNFSPTITIPDVPNKIYVWPDSCHMLKLLRNLFFEYKVIFSNSGTIKWDYIEQLHNLQDAVGLRLGNKLSKKHVNYANQKMKVSTVGIGAKIS